MQRYDDFFFPASCVRKQQIFMLFGLFLTKLVVSLYLQKNYESTDYQYK